MGCRSLWSISVTTRKYVKSLLQLTVGCGILLLSAGPSSSAAVDLAETCITHAAPPQYGGKHFEKIDPTLAIPACEQALAVTDTPELRAYYARALEKDGRVTRARWNYEQSAKADNPTGLAAMAYIRLADDGGTTLNKVISSLAHKISATEDWGLINLNANLHLQAFRQSLVSVDELKSALSRLHAPAESGSHYAQFLLGWVYQSGTGVAKDLELAETWYLKASRMGYPAAMAFLGELWEQQDHPEAAGLIWGAYEQKNNHAIFLLRDQGSKRSNATLVYVRQRLIEKGLLTTVITGAFDKTTKKALMQANGEVIPKAQSAAAPRSKSTRKSTGSSNRAKSTKKKKKTKKARSRVRERN
jgi:TPR repeat protein